MINLNQPSNPARETGRAGLWYWMGRGTSRMAESSRAFLFRCWQEPDGDGELSWRFSLTFINGKREKVGFASLEALVTYLQQILFTEDQTISEGKQP